MTQSLFRHLIRYQEIGIYKAIGASDGDLKILFLTEAACVGFFGGIGGLVLGRVVAWILGPQGRSGPAIRLPGAPGQSRQDC